MPVITVVNATAVVTERGKNRMTEALAGVISGALSPGILNQPIVPVFFKLGHVGVGPVPPPDPTLLDIVNSDGNAFQKNLAAADIQVILPPNAPEPTLRIHVFVDVNEAVLPGPEIYQEVGVFFQFGANPPDMVVYGTYPDIAKAAGLTVDFTLLVKI
jgi:hypothetical protein